MQLGIPKAKRLLWDSCPKGPCPGGCRSSTCWLPDPANLLHFARASSELYHRLDRLYQVAMFSTGTESVVLSKHRVVCRSDVFVLAFGATHAPSTRGIACRTPFRHPRPTVFYSGMISMHHSPSRGPPSIDDSRLARCEEIAIYNTTPRRGLSETSEARFDRILKPSAESIRPLLSPSRQSRQLAQVPWQLVHLPKPIIHCAMHVYLHDGRWMQ